MKVRTFVIGSALALALLLFAQKRHTVTSQPFVLHAVVDLTHPIETNDLTSSAIRPTLVNSGKNSQFHTASSAEPPETRINAPASLTPGMWTVAQIPPERLIAPLVVLDVTAKAGQNPDYQLSIEDISAWEQAHGQIPLGAVIMVRTGWESRWNSSKAYRNADRQGTMHFPGYSEEAARFLVEARNVMGLGTDTLSVDAGASKDFPVRQFTLAHSVFHLESVANLDRVPISGAMVVVAPAKLDDSSAGPVRLFALLR